MIHKLEQIHPVVIVSLFCAALSVHHVEREPLQLCLEIALASRIQWPLNYCQISPLKLPTKIEILFELFESMFKESNEK